MLILHRKRKEALCIGDGIRVVVLESDGGGARLGIEAPPHISILREEIVEQVRAENLIASRRAMEIDAPVRRVTEPASLGRPGSEG